MLQLDPRLIADLVGKDLIAFGTGGIGRIVIPYLAQEPDIKLHGVTNSRVSTVDAGTFLDTRLPIRSLDTWKKLMPDATILLCVIMKNEDSANLACETAGFRNIMKLPLDLTDALQNTFNKSRLPIGSSELSIACMANELRDTHKLSFSEFKGCHKGQTVAVIGTGLTMNFYTPVKSASHIGVNASFLRKDMKLDYYFLWHYVSEWCDKLKNYHCVKFFGRNEWLERIPGDGSDLFPEYVVEENEARRFFGGEPSREIYADISYYPLMGYYSVIFSAINFAIYTRPKRILLIGCDCAANGHFNDMAIQKTIETRQYPMWIEGYKAIKAFVKWHYPDMEVISINPVGLKGMFHDMYTEDYLEEHPEIDRAECEIFNPKDFEEN